MEAYCSWCLEKVTPNPIRDSKFKRALFECSTCGKKIVKCRACDNFARWDILLHSDDKGKNHRKYHHDQFCLEHRHEIPNFETANSKLKRPSDYKSIYEYKVRNLSKTGKVVLITGAGALGAWPISIRLAPYLGGAIGRKAGLSGSAAIKYGLAKLGLGPISAGRYGIAGGMRAIKAGGILVGGSIGTYIGNIYMRGIYKFHIRHVQEGKDPSIITINGFLSEKDFNNQKGYQDWDAVIKKYYPESDWYHVYWEAKRLYQLGFLVLGSGGSVGFSAIISKAAKHAKKHASKNVGSIGAALTTIQLSANPWHVALVNARRTGFLLAEILKRTKRKYIIIGHSLGCRVAFYTLKELAKTEEQIIQGVHLTGGAVDRKRDNWKIARKAVSGKIFNYYSKTDKILRLLYKGGTFFTESPIGISKIDRLRGVRNIDVSKFVKGHMDFKPNAQKFLEKS